MDILPPKSESEPELEAADMPGARSVTGAASEVGRVLDEVGTADSALASDAAAPGHRLVLLPLLLLLPAVPSTGLQASTGGALQLTEEQRQRVAANRQAALERRAQASASTPTAMAASSAPGAPIQLTAEQKAVVDAKRVAAQQLRAQKQAAAREAAHEREKRDMAKRLGPLRASLVLASRQQQTSERAESPQNEAGGSGNEGGRSGGGSAISAASGEIIHESTGEQDQMEQMNSVFESIAADAMSLPTLQEPPTLATRLRHYQRQALAWMASRESEENAESAATAAWGKYTLPDGTVFYVHSVSGAASLQRPRAVGAPRGGILADAMGLGKTVEVMALILHDRWALYEQQRQRREEAAASAQAAQAAQAGGWARRPAGRPVPATVRSERPAEQPSICSLGIGAVRC